VRHAPLTEIELPSFRSSKVAGRATVRRVSVRSRTGAVVSTIPVNMGSYITPIMRYAEPPDIYEGNEFTRFALGRKGNNPFIVFGINPSSADNVISDRTINRIQTFGKTLGFDGWLMLNVYPERSTDPELLKSEMDDELHWKNMECIARVLKEIEHPILCAAWGININVRPYLKACLRNIAESLPHATWKSIGVRTIEGHPRHPLYLPADSVLIDFDIPEYIA